MHKAVMSTKTQPWSGHALVPSWIPTTEEGALFSYRSVKGVGYSSHFWSASQKLASTKTHSYSKYALLSSRISCKIWNSSLVFICPFSKFYYSIYAHFIFGLLIQQLWGLKRVSPPSKDLYFCTLWVKSLIFWSSSWVVSFTMLFNDNNNSYNLLIIYYWDFAFYLTPVLPGLKRLAMAPPAILWWGFWAWIPLVWCSIWWRNPTLFLHPTEFLGFNFITRDN